MLARNPNFATNILYKIYSACVIYPKHFVFFPAPRLRKKATSRMPRDFQCNIPPTNPHKRPLEGKLVALCYSLVHCWSILSNNEGYSVVLLAINLYWCNKSTLWRSSDVSDDALEFAATGLPICSEANGREKESRKVVPRSAPVSLILPETFFTQHGCSGCLLYKLGLQELLVLFEKNLTQASWFTPDGSLTCYDTKEFTSLDVL